MKWDGYRLAIHFEPSAIRILTRGGHDWTARFPEIVAAVKTLGPAAMILDGEAVVLDAQGRSDFSALQQALGGRGGKRSADEAIFYAFDLLYFDGHDLTGMGQYERREMLANLVGDESGAIRMSESIDVDGEALLSNAYSLGLEGIIAKHNDRPYRSGRTGDWLKIKCIQSESFVVVGYESSTKMAGAIASLLLAARKGNGLVYVGSVGTGFKHSEARDLKRQLDAIKTDHPAIRLSNRKMVYVKPELIAEIEYRAWTADHQLRHASCKGLGDGADHAEIYELE